MKTLIIPLTAGALALTACGGGPAPAAPAPAAQSAAPVSCGTVPATHGTQAKVLVRQGNVDCAQAGAVATRYFARLTAADLANPDGAGPVALDPWTCGSDPGAPLTATCSTEDDREIGTVPA
ncbi:MAG TPA: hypothetical protein VHC18_10440 [Amycolatopsis sp.]|nr:hypothetical protein [Amycolatopsis sp.]